MIAYKIKETESEIGGRIFAQHENSVILLANCTQPQSFYSGWTFNKLKEKGVLEELELKDVKWIYPHLYKPIRERLNKE